MDFIICAEGLGYVISKSNVSESQEIQKKLIDFTDFSIYQVADLFQSNEENEDELNTIDSEIDNLIKENPKYYILGKLFEKYGYEYYSYDLHSYLSFVEDSDEVLSSQIEKSLLSRVIEKEHLAQTVISEANIDFILLFSSYFIVALETLIESDDKEMIAEFILNQSISTIEDDYNVEGDMGDWISDLTTDIIKYTYGFDIFDYDGECEIDGNNFGQGKSKGYNYFDFSQDIINSLI